MTLFLPQVFGVINYYKKSVFRRVEIPKPMSKLLKNNNLCYHKKINPK